MKALRRSARLSSSQKIQTSPNHIPPHDAPQEPKKRIKRTAASSIDAHETSSQQQPKKEPQGISRYHEQYYWNKGYHRVIGVDEAGRGPLAGPVVAAACIVPEDVTIVGIDDSKKLTMEQREKLYSFITTHPSISWAVKEVDVETIDRINILQATMLAMELAVQELDTNNTNDTTNTNNTNNNTITAILVDGNRLPKSFDPDRSKAIVKGDGKSVAIAAASVLAKVHRDRVMDELHKKYPQYNFAGHKGYGVPEHVENIRQHGPSPVHRKTFAPVKVWFPEFVAGGSGGGVKKDNTTKSKKKKSE